MSQDLTTKKIEISGQTVYFQSAKNMKQIPSESITLVITSPPYWNVRDYGDHEDQIGFNQSYEEYIGSLNQVWRECIRVLQPNGKIAINVQPLPIESSKSGFGRRVIKNIMWDIEQFMRENNLFLSGMHYWSKIPYISNVSWGSYPKPTNIASNTAFEQIFVWVKPGKTRKIPKEILDQNLLTKDEWRHWSVRCIWDDISPVIKIDSKGVNKFGHSAPFPEDIPYRLIRMHTVAGETVLDPFLGSGTTLKVCRITGRKGFGFEINEDYEDLITSRILEDWSPPDIQSQYKVFGTSDVYQILQVAQDTLCQNSSIEFTTLLKKLRKILPNKFTKSWIEHTLRLYNRNKDKT
ncbi:MAG: DNA-methyltransferase [Candidatus Hodarchaeales archaeon]